LQTLDVKFNDSYAVIYNDRLLVDVSRIFGKALLFGVNLTKKDFSLFFHKYSIFHFQFGLPNNECVLTLEAVDDTYGEDSFVLGAPWFRSACAAFDLGRNGVITGGHSG
jgi:hypothetical protein